MKFIRVTPVDSLGASLPESKWINLEYVAMVHERKAGGVLTIFMVNGNEIGTLTVAANPELIATLIMQP
ncbi:MAG TPA: hypothetical protein VNZ86_12250 [Bacteroidia bacterium]|jgi:hypothetical protein|nr:hypothetical protein [Bacteroidia bacterium]